MTQRPSAVAVACKIYQQVRDSFDGDPVADVFTVKMRADEMVKAGLTMVQVTTTVRWSEGIAWLRENHPPNDYTWMGMRFFFWDADMAFEFKMRFG